MSDKNEAAAPRKLTASEIREMDEITIDRRTANATLEVALQFHSNTLNQLTRKEREFWERLGERFNLDIKSRLYRLAHIEGAVCVVPSSDD